MRQVCIFIGRIKSKLQNLHARESEMFTKRIYLIRNDTEIFCNDRQIVAECLGDRTKEIPARHLRPVSVDGSRFAVRDRPACVKATEMVDTQDVQILKLCADTRDPPGEIAVLMCIPCIERIAPELPGCRKIIRRNSRNRERIPFLVQVE